MKRPTREAVVSLIHHTVNVLAGGASVRLAEEWIEPLSFVLRELDAATPKKAGKK